MNIIIRQEQETDNKAVFNLTEKAFTTMEHSDGDEHFQVERLRKCDAYIPELSLVALYNDVIDGHIMLTKAEIVNQDKIYNSLAIAPVSVLPECQKKGIGSKLILRSHEIAKELGYKSVVLVGHENYYPRFGYEKASQYEIKFPFEVPDINAMAIELEKGALKNISGEVRHPKEFFEQA